MQLTKGIFLLISFAVLFFSLFSPVLAGAPPLSAELVGRNISYIEVRNVLDNVDYAKNKDGSYSFGYDIKCTPSAQRIQFMPIYDNDPATGWIDLLDVAKIKMALGFGVREYKNKSQLADKTLPANFVAVKTSKLLNVKDNDMTYFGYYREPNEKSSGVLQDKRLNFGIYYEGFFTTFYRVGLGGIEELYFQYVKTVDFSDAETIDTMLSSVIREKTLRDNIMGAYKTFKSAQSGSTALAAPIFNIADNVILLNAYLVETLTSPFINANKDSLYADVKARSPYLSYEDTFSCREFYTSILTDLQTYNKNLYKKSTEAGAPVQARIVYNTGAKSKWLDTETMSDYVYDPSLDSYVNINTSRTSNELLAALYPITKLEFKGLSGNNYYFVLDEKTGVWGTRLGSNIKEFFISLFVENEGQIDNLISNKSYPEGVQNALGLVDYMNSDVVLVASPSGESINTGNSNCFGFDPANKKITKFITNEQEGENAITRIAFSSGNSFEYKCRKFNYKESSAQYSRKIEPRLITIVFERDFGTSLQNIGVKYSAGLTSGIMDLISMKYDDPANDTVVYTITQRNCATPLVKNVINVTKENYTLLKIDIKGCLLESSSNPKFSSKQLDITKDIEAFLSTKYKLKGSDKEIPLSELIIGSNDPAVLAQKLYRGMSLVVTDNRTIAEGGSGGLDAVVPKEKLTPPTNVSGDDGKNKWVVGINDSKIASLPFDTDPKIDYQLMLDMSKIIDSAALRKAYGEDFSKRFSELVIEVGKDSSDFLKLTRSKVELLNDKLIAFWRKVEARLTEYIESKKDKCYTGELKIRPENVEAIMKYYGDLETYVKKLTVINSKTKVIVCAGDVKGINKITVEFEKIIVFPGLEQCSKSEVNYEIVLSDGGKTYKGSIIIPEGTDDLFIDNSGTSAIPIVAVPLPIRNNV